jgi:hypothetical protein
MWILLRTADGATARVKFGALIDALTHIFSEVAAGM